MSETLGTRLRKLRNGKSLRQIDVSDAVDISRNFLSELENDSQPASKATLLKLAKYFGITIDALWQGVTPPPETSEVVEDPDERALLAFWRGLDASQKKLFLKLIASGAVGS